MATMETMSSGAERPPIRTFKDLANEIKRQAGDSVQAQDIFPKDCSFAVSPKEFEEFRQICYKLQISTASIKIEYDGGILQFFNMSKLHNEISRVCEDLIYAEIIQQAPNGGWTPQTLDGFFPNTTGNAEIELHKDG